MGSGPDSAQALTVDGVEPPELGTGGGATPVGAVERAALQRVRADLLGVRHEPVRLGRFVLLGRLGAGGMGVVYGGYDDALDRKIAIKLISPERATNEQARRRLFREAQAMAKLSHPNVVQVFEAGEDDGRLFVAMEFVEGTTLRPWLRDGPARGWREIVALFLEIGAGLAAAHAAGIVHRDFKPDNVLVGADGRPKVADFGVASLDTAASSMEGVVPSASAVVADDTGTLTRTGDVMGTPAYMSPEHCRGRTTDAKSDQFSFCIVLYEALYGERPFGGESPSDVMRNIAGHRLRPIPDGVSVPGWIREAVLQGLALRPEDRHPSMGALLRVLASDPRARARRIGTMAGLVAVGAVGIGALVVRDRGPAPCTDGRSRLSGVWDAEREGEVARAIEAVDLPYAADTATRVQTALETYAARWAVSYRDACEATRVRGDQSEHLMDLRMACLGRAKAELRAVVGQLAEADALTVERAVRIASGLPHLDRCTDVDALQAQVPAPDDPATAQAVDELRARRAEATAMRRAGKHREAEVSLEELQQRAERIDYAPVRAEIDLSLGSVLLSLGRWNEAESMLQRALARALADGNTDVAAEAASSLTLLLGDRLARFDEARWLGQVALGLATRHGDEQALAMVHTNLGGMLLGQAKFDEAEVELRRALELLERALDPDDVGLAAGLENLSIALYRQYELEEAEVLQRRAHALRLRALGPEHPELATSHANLATTLTDRGQLAEAEIEHRRALVLFERTYGPDHPDMGMSWGNLGITLDGQGRHVEAEEAYRRGLVVFERAYGPDHGYVAGAHMNLGASMQAQGRLDDAEQEFRVAVDIYERGAKEHPDLARGYTNIGLVLEAQNEGREAVAAHERALEIAAATLPPEHPDVAIAQMHLGVALAAVEAYAEATDHLEHALDRLVASEVSRRHVATASFALARSLAVLDEDQARAVSLAENAAEIWRAEQLREGPGETLAEVESWLARQRSP